MVHLPSPRRPTPGAWRAGLWYDPQPKDRFDGSGAKRHDLGRYVIIDQVFLPESANDRQGLGLFFRFGAADREVNTIARFWSTGCQYRGFVPGRDHDVLGVDLARAVLASDAGAGLTAGYETVDEICYGIQATGWLQVSPHVQYVVNPGGMSESCDAVIADVRVRATF